MTRALVWTLALAAGCATTTPPPSPPPSSQPPAGSDGDDAPPPSATAPTHTAAYKMCLELNGSVSSAELLRAQDVSDEAAANGAAWLKARKFPAQRFAQCTTVSVVFDPAGAKEPALMKPRNVAPHYFDEHIVAKKVPELPDTVKIKYRGHELQWMGKVCANVDGDINQVSVVSGIPDADGAIVSALREWKLRPPPIPVCTLVRFVFTVSAPAGRRP